MAEGVWVSHVGHLNQQTLEQMFAQAYALDKVRLVKDFISLMIQRTDMVMHHGDRQGFHVSESQI
jgi:hypothetical protein